MSRRHVNLRMLVPLVIGVPGCLAAGWFELTRALDGRMVAWVYAFEWPMYAVLGVFMWWRIWHRPRPTTSAVPRQSQPPDPVEDAELVAWQQYVARLQSTDRPGGPPPR